jgi:predicted ATPase
MEARPYLREISLRDNTEREQQYPFSIPAIREMGTIRFHRDVTFFVGENGTGFSTRASESELSGSLRMVRSFRPPRASRGELRQSGHPD